MCFFPLSFVEMRFFHGPLHKFEFCFVVFWRNRCFFTAILTRYVFFFSLLTKFAFFGVFWRISRIFVVFWRILGTLSKLPLFCDSLTKFTFSRSPLTEYTFFFHDFLLNFSFYSDLLMKLTVFTLTFDEFRILSWRNTFLWSFVEIYVFFCGPLIKFRLFLLSFDGNRIFSAIIIRSNSHFLRYLLMKFAYSPLLSDKIWPFFAILWKFASYPRSFEKKKSHFNRSPLTKFAF